MIRFLSPEWIAALDQALAGVKPPSLTEPLVIQHTVTDAPDDLGGEVIYHLRIDATGSGAATGPPPDFTVSFTQTFATASAIATGDKSAQAAFMGGDLRVGGRVDMLIAHQTALLELDEVTAPLRAATVF